MKKKPSLLDIEMFVQKRAEERQKELSQIEAYSADHFDENRNNTEIVEPNEYKAVKENKHSENIKQQVSNVNVPAETPNLHPNQQNNTEVKPHQLESQQVNIVEEMLTSIIEVTDSQRDDINKIKQDMFKLKEQLRVYHSFLSNQQKKISEIEKLFLEREHSIDYSNKGIIDTNYSKLLLKNIVWLKEEKDFSSNDVARLFRAEGFQTPHPHESWNEKVINQLYAEAKKSFL